MTMMPMFKTCPKCGHRYTCNPSVGDLGFFCPKCGGAAGMFGRDDRDNGRTIFDRIKDIFDQRRS